MKLNVILAAAAIALGSTAFAANDHDSNYDRDHPRAEHSGPSAGQKLRDAMHRIGEKTRHAFHRADHKVEKTAHRDRDANDTRAMGAPAGHMSDQEHARRERMDSAYDNWHNQQKR